MFRYIRALVAALTLGVAALVMTPNMAVASECNVVPGMNLYFRSNGEAGCGKIVISHINGDPNHFWLTWYVQDVIDFGSDSDNTTLSFTWATNVPGGYLGSDINSADYIVQSGYQYRSVPVGVNLNNIKGTLVVHGETMTKYMPVYHEWI